LLENLYFRTVAQLQGIAGFEVDLVEAQAAMPHVVEAIAQRTNLRANTEFWQQEFKKSWS